MIVVPAGVKVHLALGYTDMRKGARWTCDADPGTPEEGSLHMCRVWICGGVFP